MNRFSVFILGFLVLVDSLLAQHAIDVQRKVADREYFQALHTYDRMAKRRRTLEAQIAAGHAAWALSLTKRSIEEFENALQSDQLSDLDRAQLLLSRGIIEYQEARYRVAVLYAERVVDQFAQSHVLRARALLLWGDSLLKLDSLGLAEEKYLAAIKELPSDEQYDAYFHLGICQMQLGKLEQARKSLQGLPLQHERAPAAIRNLAAIALDQEQFREAAFWLKRGRESFPNQFLDSWVDYAMAKVAISEDKPVAVTKILGYAEQKYPPSDHWLTLLQAAVEAYRWQNSKLLEQ